MALQFDRNEFRNVDTPLLGTDPEFFVKDGKGKIIPSWMFLPSKEAEWKTVQAVKTFVDGFQGEIGFDPKKTGGIGCIETMAYYVKMGLHKMLRKAREFDASATLTLENTPEFTLDYLASLDDAQVELGCSPSFNAYDMPGDFPPNPRALPYRFAGGHMHFGNFGFWNRETKKFDAWGPKGEAQTVTEKQKDDYFIPIVKTLDAVLGVYMTAVAASFDNPVRRKYYGLAGEYRKPAHGLEYRTLSNVWLAAPGIFHVAFMIARGAIQMEACGLSKFWIAPPEWVIQIINTCDYKEARKLLELNEELFHHLFHVGMKNASGPPATMSKAAFNMAMNGLESVWKNPHDFETNWALEGDENRWDLNKYQPAKTWLQEVQRLPNSQTR